MDVIFLTQGFRYQSVISMEQFIVSKDVGRTHIRSLYQ